MLTMCIIWVHKHPMGTYISQSFAVYLKPFTNLHVYNFGQVFNSYKLYIFSKSSMSLFGKDIAEQGTQRQHAAST